MQLHIVNVETGEQVRLDQGTFLLRIFNLEDGVVQRCFIRHVASGREAYVQGGKNLRSFVKSCILQSGQSSSETSRLAGSEKPLSEPQGDDLRSRLGFLTPDASEEDTHTPESE
jgi:hypothetical protein